MHWFAQRLLEGKQTAATRLDFSLVLRNGFVADNREDYSEDGQRRSRPEFAIRLPVSAGTCNEYYWNRADEAIPTVLVACLCAACKLHRQRTFFSNILLKFLKY